MSGTQVIEINSPFHEVNGKITINLLREGLFFKYADLEIGSLPETDSGIFQAGIRVIITLEGKTNIQFEEQLIHLDAQHRPVAVCLPINKEIYGIKHFEPNSRQKELVMFIESKWLKNAGFVQASDYSHFAQLTQIHLQPHFLYVNKKALSLISHIIEIASSASFCQCLTKESYCLNLLSELFLQLPAFQAKENRTLKYKRIAKLTEILQSGQADDWNLSRMANAIHSNVTTLQRDFKQIHGVSVMYYMRQLKLERSYHALLSGKTISEAAAIAGYTNPDNFTTAFKRYFNIVPSKVKKDALFTLVR